MLDFLMGVFFYLNFFNKLPFDKPGNIQAGVIRRPQTPVICLTALPGKPQKKKKGGGGPGLLFLLLLLLWLGVLLEVRGTMSQSQMTEGDRLHIFI